jgi:hypothetical protein
MEQQQILALLQQAKKNKKRHALRHPDPTDIPEGFQIPQTLPIQQFINEANAGTFSLDQLAEVFKRVLVSLYQIPHYVVNDGGVYRRYSHQDFYQWFGNITVPYVDPHVVRIPIKKLCGLLPLPVAT